MTIARRRRDAAHRRRRLRRRAGPGTDTEAFFADDFNYTAAARRCWSGGGGLDGGGLDGGGLDGEVATLVGVSRATARRYLSSLADDGAVDIQLRYGTTGRPEDRYGRPTS
ncbi:hypothetical protein ABIB27_002087 [Arthrobacter sp. UYEF21]